MSETYRIDEGKRRVFVSSGGAFPGGIGLPFSWLENGFMATYYSMRREIEAGAIGFDLDRWHVYAVARDELLERGLIDEPEGPKR